MKPFLIDQPVKQLRDIKSFPVISLLIPFEPKMSTSSELEERINRILLEVRRRLEIKYDSIEVTKIIHRLNRICNQLDYLTYKKSLVIFVSPAEEKIYYLDIAVQEKIIIDEPFGFQEVVENKKEIHQYLVLVL